MSAAARSSRSHGYRAARRCRSSQAWRFAWQARRLQRRMHARACRSERGSCCLLPIQQRAFSLDAPAIAGDCAIGAHDAVARNSDGNTICAASLCHCAHGFRRADPLGEVAIACGGARGDLADRLPHPLLEGRAADVERQIEATSRRLDKADYLRHKPLECFIATKKLRFGEAVLQSTDQRLRIIAELDRAHAFTRGGDEDRTERALANRKANDVAAPAA